MNRRAREILRLTLRRSTDVTSLLQPSRIALLGSALSGPWLVMYLGRAIEAPERVAPYLKQWPLAASLAVAALLSMGLHLYGIAINDALDVRHDRLFIPNRPIPAGRIQPSQAAASAVFWLLLGIVLAIPLGTPTALLAVGAALIILFYDTSARFFPGLGILSLGLFRAAVMFLANPQLGFAWPIWLDVTHLVACAAIGHRLAGKRPALRAPAIWVLCSGWLFWSLALIGHMGVRQSLLSPGHAAIWVPPAIAGMAFGVIAFVLVRRAGGQTRHETGEQFQRLALIWLIVFDACWLAGAGLWWQTATLVAVLLATLLLPKLNQLAHASPDGGRTPADVAARGTP
jgi:4-hydroxybenzoate polyprenyltransferase